ncbi:hypothetical protein [Haloarcula amylovorans]|uniref:hypothetical protein n=1 Tax=Haloarcula amylovorans TaxID=2562280 RepID=UPI001076A912|nr:hypothetical protein [Halomicroarcula amylolytica]
MQNRGLLTDDDRALFRGEKDIDAEEETKQRRERRHNIRQRIDHIEEDLEILAEADEERVLQDFHEQTDKKEALIGRIERLEQAVLDDE